MIELSKESARDSVKQITSDRTGCNFSRRMQVALNLYSLMQY